MALRTDNLKPESFSEKLCPRNVLRRTGGFVLLGGRGRRLDGGRHDGTACGGVRRENTEIASQMPLRRRDERSQSSDQGERRKIDGARAIGPGLLELQSHVAVAEDLETIIGERWAQDVSAKRVRNRFKGVSRAEKAGMERRRWPNLDGCRDPRRRTLPPRPVRGQTMHGRRADPGLAGPAAGRSAYSNSSVWAVGLRRVMLRK